MTAKGKKQLATPKPRTPAKSARAVEEPSALSDRAKWQLAFGFRDAVDLPYIAHPPPQKPRLPTAIDHTQPWCDVVLPETVDELLGNARATAFLHGIQQGTQPTETNFIISGGEGSGKRSFLRLLERTLTEATAATDIPCVYHAFNAKLLPDREIVIKIEDAMRKMDSKENTLFIIIEHFEVVPAAIQQHHVLPLIAVCNAKNIFAILVVQPDASKLPDQLRQRSVFVHMTPLDATQVRSKILQICENQKIGYHREALEELLQLCHFDLLGCIAKLQQVFVSYAFVSLANVHKITLQRRKTFAPAGTAPNPIAPVPPPFPLSIISLNEPLRRCKLCTLIPPCSHVTLQHLCDRLERIRQYYPTREDEMPPKPVCPSFCQRGICANTQAIGRCRYAHPNGLHKIDTSAIVKRCGLHTLPLPCLHCDHIQQAKYELREQEIAVTRIQKELSIAKKLLLEKETERYMFVREHTKTVKWGAARRDYEDKLAQLDAKIQTVQSSVDEHQQELQERHKHIQRLGNNVSRGYSKGLGRGSARQQPDIKSA